jgi:hypothetical protein
LHQSLCNPRLRIEVLSRFPLDLVDQSTQSGSLAVQPNHRLPGFPSFCRSSDSAAASVCSSRSSISAPSATTSAAAAAEFPDALTGTHIGQIEVKPQPAFMLMDAQCIDKFFRRTSSKNQLIFK